MSRAVCDQVLSRSHKLGRQLLFGIAQLEAISGMVAPARPVIGLTASNSGGIGPYLKFPAGGIVLPGWEEFDGKFQLKCSPLRLLSAGLLGSC